MCGIAGIHAYLDVAPSVDRSELGRMNLRMAARGPDGSGD
jgi:asparagine synthase (glutamine-hydrolysing)